MIWLLHKSLIVFTIDVIGKGTTQNLYLLEKLWPYSKRCLHFVIIASSYINVEAIDFLLLPHFTSKKASLFEFLNHFLQTLGRHRTTTFFFIVFNDRSFFKAANAQSRYF